MMKAIGKTTWLIPDMYWPEITSPGHYVSHEAICVLNTSDDDCFITLDLYYEDREPVLGLQECCKAKRTRHIRLDKLRDASGAPLPMGVAYAAVVNCSVPVVVQYTRVDTTQSENSIMTTIAYPV
jgi:hypothetical protein